jgi:hypothetical protein
MYLFRARRHAARLSPGEHAFALMTSRFLDALRERVLFFDGGMGTQLQARELSATTSAASAGKAATITSR